MHGANNGFIGGLHLFDWSFIGDSNVPAECTLIFQTVFCATAATIVSGGMAERTYAEASGIPYEMGLLKNKYVGRTFIQPTQEMRDKGVRMKLSPVRSIVNGKRVILIDDSIVRGTTSRRIVGLLREAGATEVHVCIASPKYAFPCYYGVDTGTSEELIG